MKMYTGAVPHLPRQTLRFHLIRAVSWPPVPGSTLWVTSNTLACRLSQFVHGSHLAGRPTLPTSRAARTSWRRWKRESCSWGTYLVWDGVTPGTSGGTRPCARCALPATSAWGAQPTAAGQTLLNCCCRSDHGSGDAGTAAELQYLSARATLISPVCVPFLLPTTHPPGRWQAPTSIRHTGRAEQRDSDAAGSSIANTSGLVSQPSSGVRVRVPQAGGGGSGGPGGGTPRKLFGHCAAGCHHCMWKVAMIGCHRLLRLALTPQ